MPDSSMCSDQLAAGFIEPLAHRVVFGDPVRNSLRLILLEEPSRRIVWRVRQKRRVPDEKRLLVRHRAIDEIKDRLHPIASDSQPVVAMPSARLWKPPGHSLGESAPLIGTFPPLAALVADVALLCQPPGKSAGLVDVGNEKFPDVFARFLGVGLVRGRAGRVVSGRLVLMRIQTGGQRHQSGPAQRGRDIAAPKHHAFLGELVEMRRFDRRMPHETIVGVTLVIGDNQNDVRRLRIGGGCGCRHQEKRKQAKDVFHVVFHLVLRTARGAG